MSLQPFFIIGNPRSGTTLLRLILNAHQGLMVPPECGFAVWLFENYKYWSYESLERKINEFVNDLVGTRKFETWNIPEKIIKSFIRRQKPCDYSKLINCIYQLYGICNDIEYSIWGDKNNFYLNHIMTIKLIFPKLKIIYIVRDGRDVACSYREINRLKLDNIYAPKLPYKIEKIAIEWVRNNMVILESLESLEEESNLCVRYEDLVEKTEDVLEIICTFLGVRYNDYMLDFYKNDKGNEPVDFLKWKNNITNPIAKYSVGRYKKELTNKEINIFNKTSKKILSEFGYE